MKIRNKNKKTKSTVFNLDIIKMATWFLMLVLETKMAVFILAEAWRVSSLSLWIYTILLFLFF